MRWNVITLFPQMIENALREGVVGQAFNRGDVELRAVNPRTFTGDVHHTVDDRPFGGGDGMVMLGAPLRQAMASLGVEAGHRVLLSPQGRKWSDSDARKWAERGGAVTLVCGRYGGIDQRFINDCIDEEVSIGDYVLSGGEFAALVLIDSVVRLLPEVLGNARSAHDESFADDGLLEAPLFTRPSSLDGSKELASSLDAPKELASKSTATATATQVPRIFLSGDHKKIAEARRILSLLVTEQKRPDLLRPVHRAELSQVKAKPLPFTAEELVVCGLNPSISGPMFQGDQSGR